MSAETIDTTDDRDRLAEWAQANAAEMRTHIAMLRAGTKLPPDIDAKVDTLLRQCLSAAVDREQAIDLAQATIATDAELSAASAAAAKAEVLLEVYLHLAPDAAIDDAEIDFAVEAAIEEAAAQDGRYTVDEVRAAVAEALPNVARRRIDQRLAIWEAAHVVTPTAEDAARVLRLWRERGIPPTMTTGEAVRRGLLTWDDVRVTRKPDA